MLPRGSETAPLLGPKGAGGHDENGSSPSYVADPQEYNYSSESSNSSSGSGRNLPESSKLKRSITAHCWIMVFELLLIAVCALCIVWVSQSHIMPFRHLQNFGARACLVQDKHFEISDSTFYSYYRGVARVSYRDDDGLQTSAIVYNRVDGSYSSLLQVIDFLDDFEPGASVTCYVDPRNPYYASLDRAQSVGGEALVWIVVLSLLGLGVLVSFLNSLYLLITMCRIGAGSAFRSSSAPSRHARSAKPARSSASATHGAV